MALQTANQFQLNTDFSRLGTGIQQVQKIASQFQAGQDRKAKLGQAQQATQLSGQALGGNSEALGGLAAIDPARANQIQKYLSSLSEADRIESDRENTVMTRVALNAKLLPKDKVRPYLQKERDKAANDGRNTDKIDGALKGDDKSLNQAIDLQAREGQTVKSLYEAQFPDESNLSAAESERASLLKAIKPALNEDGKIDMDKLDASSKSAAVKLGLIAKESTSADERIANNKKLAEDVAEAARLKAAAKETGKLSAQLKLKPKVDAAVVTAVAQAKFEADIKTDNRSNQKAFDVYNAAKTNLVSALGGTITGPGAGWIPALTADAQIANGAVAMMAPVLKQLFRASGEGTFTDKDQEMLIAMVPTRDTLPEARVVQLAAIDSIVSAKLGNISEEAKVKTGQQETNDQSEPDNGLSQLSDEQLAAEIAKLKGAE